MVLKHPRNRHHSASSAWWSVVHSRDKIWPITSSVDKIGPSDKVRLSWVLAWSRPQGGAADRRLRGSAGEASPVNCE